MIRVFLERESYQQGGILIPKSSQHKEVQRRIKEKIELNAFFTRAIQEEVVKINPVKPLGPTNLTLSDLKNLSPQIQIEYELFNNYVQSCLDKKSFTVYTSKPVLCTMRMLLFDVEAFQVTKSDWPTDLDGWFSHPKWVITWLDLLRSRWLYGKSEVQQQKITKRYLNAIRYIWLFLMDQGRTTVHFYENLRYEFERRNATLDQLSLRIIEGDLKQIDPHTRVYLQTDQQRLQAEVEQVKQTGASRVKNPGVRLNKYSIIKKLSDFIIFETETGKKWPYFTIFETVVSGILRLVVNFAQIIPQILRLLQDLLLPCPSAQRKTE